MSVVARSHRVCRTLVALVLLTSISCARPSIRLGPPNPPIVLAVIAWNMHAGSGDLRRLIDDLTSGRLAETPVPHYVLLLQEAIEPGANGIGAIANARGLSTFLSPVRVMNQHSAGNALVSTLPLRAARRIDLPRERQPRAAVAATIDINGRELFVVSTHLENRVSWWRGGLFSDGARGRQAAALLQALPPVGHGIVGGDLNTWLGPNEPAWRSLLARFRDTPPDRPRPTFRERLVLDHLFFDLPDGWRARRQVVPERYGSDHHPVLGIITGS